ncbi:hypothetical protein C7293_23465 [filamentous cyanobacterium CCT1]|nr:hypothetical protein C7293_23465 [filamentous cyanobacterium CCT1]PSN80775.1 hypothetical protein C8B47_04670 [filamentous cyanobacterium CCP4]
MSSIDLSPNQDFFNEESATAALIPDDAFLSSNSVLSLLAAFDPSFSELVADFADALPDAVGQVAIADGLFDVELMLADGTALTGSFDAPATLRSYADLAAVSDGTVTLSGGILEAAIAAEGETAALSDFDLSAATSALVLGAVSAIDATIPLTNGAFVVDLPSALGPISGTIDVAGGDLNLDLATPFGQLVADIDFQDDAIFPFTAPVPVLGDITGAVDFNSGNIVASLGAFGDLALPISALSGELTLADGLADLTATLPVGSGTSLPVASDIELGPLASEYVAEFVQDLEGTGTLTNGILDATVESPLGLFETVFDVVAFTSQGANFFAGVDGVIDINNGIATSLLTTPLGDIDGSVDLTTVSPALETPIAELI